MSVHRTVSDLIRDLSTKGESPDQVRSSGGDWRVRAAASLMAAILPMKSAAEPKTIARTSIYENEIVLLEDGTWRFSNDNISLERLNDLSAEYCFALAAERVTLCELPEGWTRSEIISDGTEEAHTFDWLDESASMTVTVQDEFGHEGDIDDYIDMANDRSLGETVILKAFEIAAGARMPKDRATVVGDIIIHETFGATLDIFDYYSVDVMTADQSLLVEVTALKKEDTDSSEPLDFKAALRALTDTIHVDGTPLSAHLAREEAK